MVTLLTIFFIFKPSLLNLFFPLKCINCQAYGSFLCDRCQKQIEWVETQVCHVCKKPSRQGKTCYGCLRLFNLNGLMVSAFYDELLQKLIKQYKYRFSEEVGTILAEWLATSINKNFSKTAFHLIYVPLHKKRFRWRGFNQAENLARLVGSRLQLPVTPLLIRVKDRPGQAGLSRGQRLHNLTKAFTARGDTVLPEKILLIDDVVSTGATLQACATTLYAAGVKEVWGAVVARG